MGRGERKKRSSGRNSTQDGRGVEDQKKLLQRWVLLRNGQKKAFFLCLEKDSLTRENCKNIADTQRVGEEKGGKGGFIR